MYGSASIKCSSPDNSSQAHIPLLLIRLSVHTIKGHVILLYCNDLRKASYNNIVVEVIIIIDRVAG